MACKEKYMPEISKPDTGFLVVEGFINVGTGPTIIQLTRTAGLDSTHFSFEAGAHVLVETESGMNFPMTESSPGKYIVNQVTPIDGQRYRVHITTKNGRNYLSDLTEVKTTPEIDSVNWTTDGENVSIFVNTHDPNNQTLYYKWQFEETWQYTSYYLSSIKYQDDSISVRTPDEQFFYCYRNDYSKSISLSTSADLSQDIIARYPLTSVSILNTDKLVVRYSILVKQYALTKEWYEWNLKIKKNTEQLGSIFDAQPSGTGGNVHCTTDPSEAVIGYIGSTTEADKRIFIDHTEVPGSYNHGYPASCDSQFVRIDSAEVAKNLRGHPDKLPIEFVRDMKTSEIIGIQISDAICVDCNLQGGSSVKPPFWQ